ncbi:MAG TPA: beta-ketoacyl synthase N-terminal-like domain-containing protein, partial [Polyangiaceae bacterium]|nr:beta-ketoacyl synthase N-terminal-like domain-containing protein [Polyangiaceae bacterium]
MTALREAFVVDAVRTPIARFRGGLASVRADDLAAHILTALLARHSSAGPRLDQVIFGATNQAGEDNRNVARMAALVAGLPFEVPAVTVNRLCGSGLEAVCDGVRRIATGDADVVIAGGVESMTRAPFAFAKTDEAFSRTPPKVFDTTLGWRFENPRMAARFPLLSMGETAEEVA